MLEADALELMAQAFVTGWPAASLAIVGAPVPYVLDNDTMPSADVFAQQWAVPLTSAQITMGDHARFERGGLVYVKVWTPRAAPAPNGGSSLAVKLCHVVRTFYERKQLGGAPGVEPVTLGAGLALRGGAEGRWYTRTIQHAYRFYEQT